MKQFFRCGNSRLPVLALPFILVAVGGLACNAQPIQPPTPFPTPAPQVDQPPATDTAAPPATEAEPPRERPSGKIAYTCQVFAESTQDQICVINVNGTGRQRLTGDDQSDHFFPSFTPDGQRILFSSNQSGVYEIYEMDLAGNQTQLTQLGDAYAPAVSPDNDLIVFTIADEETSALWLMRRDGSNPQMLIEDAWDAAWAPDGATILHASDRGGSVQLWAVAADGTGLRQITNLENLRGRNDWSPQFTSLATYAGTPWNREILVFAPDGSDVRQITEGGNNLAPSFSPDGEWITFTSYRDRYRDENGCEIYVMRIDGTDIMRLTDNEFCDWQPRWGS